MTARDFLKLFIPDDRLVSGGYFQSEPIKIESGDTVGVVLLGSGGPRSEKEVKPFLYNQYMDPVTTDMPFGGIFRHWFSQLLATLRSRKVARDFEALGGGAPENRLYQEQAESLETLLNERFQIPYGVTFKTYLAMRFWHPTSEAAALTMLADGVNKVVLLPLSPQYSKMTTGSSVGFWWQLGQQKEIPDWPTVLINEYAIHPKYIQAINDRINEGLQRFNRQLRNKVHLAFCAPGTPLQVMKQERDRYCCLLHNTVDRLMSGRKDGNTFSVSFLGNASGPTEWLSPFLEDTIDKLAGQEERNVLVIPLSFATDTITSAYELDIVMRKRAKEAGISQFEVAAGLNNHPLFIEALAEASTAALQFPFSVDPYGTGDGASMMLQQPAVSVNSESKCAHCGHRINAKSWEGSFQVSNQ